MIIMIPAYRDFSCLATNCPENCCKVFRILFFKWEQQQFSTKQEWQDVDGNGNPLSSYLKNSDGECLLGKNDKGHCHFLTGEKLCSLQKKFGLGALPSVCRTFPRLITRFGDRTEYALDTCCVQVLRMLKDWTPGDLVIEGGSEPTDEKYVVRKRAMGLFADESITFGEAMKGLGKMYENEWDCSDLEFSKEQLFFLRRAVAATIWAYALPYMGHHNHPKSMVAILDFLKEFLPSLAESGTCGWDEMSAMYSRALSEYVKRVKFDDDIEERYIDMFQDINQ